MARSANGKEVDVYSPKAVSFCLLGAIDKCCTKPEEYERVRDLVESKVGIICAWNDDKNRKFSEIKKLVKELDI